MINRNQKKCIFLPVTFRHLKLSTCKGNNNKLNITQLKVQALQV